LKKLDLRPPDVAAAFQVPEGYDFPGRLFTAMFRLLWFEGKRLRVRQAWAKPVDDRPALPSGRFASASWDVNWGMGT